MGDAVDYDAHEAAASVVYDRGYRDGADVVVTMRDLISNTSMR